MANRGGRPKKQINQSQFETMCSIQATEEEICLVLGVSDKTLNRWCKASHRENIASTGTISAGTKKRCYGNMAR